MAVSGRFFSAAKVAAFLALSVAALGVAPAAHAETAASGPVRDVEVVGGPAGEEVRTLVDRLGDERTGGVYLDRAERRFVVAVTDGETAGKVERAGAMARRVAYSTEHLEGIKEKLDKTFWTPGTTWGVDIPANQVVVRADSTVSDESFAELEAFVGSYGEAATILRVPGETRPAASPINGGDYIQNGSTQCSYGFTVRNKSKPSELSILTAGHCTITAGKTWYKSNGMRIGYTTGANYVNGNDFGLIRADNRPAVTYYGNVEAAGGVSQDIYYSRDSKVGETVCASGYRSKYACNSVGAKNQTITYTNGHRVTGMDVVAICRAGGDSGGPLFARDAALGILSGSNSSTCYSYYQPVNEALAWYGVEVF
ncbi:S1 family peptidase [Streptomyces bacillaris]|uniref:S1 family peptidase n=1 Tax=Streptomyces bacillaris TaxID=68179 RepID=UPI0037F318F3